MDKHAELLLSAGSSTDCSSHGLQCSDLASLGAHDNVLTVLQNSSKPIRLSEASGAKEHLSASDHPALRNRSSERQNLRDELCGSERLFQETLPKLESLCRLLQLESADRIVLTARQLTVEHETCSAQEAKQLFYVPSGELRMKFSEFVLSGEPVLIKGLEKQKVLQEQWNLQSVRRKYGSVRVRVGKLPYAGTYGQSFVATTVKQFIDEEVLAVPGQKVKGLVEADGSVGSLKALLGWDHNSTYVNGARFPLYLFDGGIIARQHQKDLSSETMPWRSLLGDDRRVLLEQFILGSTLSGANLHFHNQALNGLLFGRKLWLLLPPARACFSSLHPQVWLDWFLTQIEASLSYLQRDDDLPMGHEGDELEAGKLVEMLQKMRPVVFVQSAGDVVYVPPSWGHLVLNLAVSAALAVEFAN